MAKETKSTIMVATISAISAIVIALITTYGTIAVSAPEAKKVKDELKEISDLRLIKNLPIGTIVPSMLRPTEFAKAVGDLERGTIEWVLADGQKDITNSRYGQLSGKTTTPDLRGVFLRGMNVNGGKDPEQNRTAGHYQPDALQQHYHMMKAIDISWDGEGQGVRSAPNNKFIGGTVTDVTNARTADETRPKNVAVYFYIKIN